MNYYAQLNQNQIAFAITQSSDFMAQHNLVPIHSLDDSVLGKRWTGQEWEALDRPPDLQLSKLAFLRRFTAEERIAIRASTDPVIVDFLHLLDLAQEVQLDDADTQAGVRYLESAGLLAAGRAEVILAPEQV